MVDLLYSTNQLFFGTDHVKVVNIKMGAILEYSAILIDRVQFVINIILWSTAGRQIFLLQGECSTLKLKGTGEAR